MNIDTYRIRLGTLLGAILLVFVPSVAWSGATLYTGEIRIRMFSTEIPYGAYLSAPVMMNVPPGGIHDTIVAVRVRYPSRSAAAAVAAIANSPI